MAIELAHDTQGTGPLVVLVHGITENRHAWDPLTEDLARDHRVVRVDTRGHGESPDADSYEIDAFGPDLAAYIDEPPLLIGHSLGGLVVTGYAGAHPCRGVINIDQPLQFEAFRQGAQAAEPALRSDAFQATVDAIFDSFRGPLPDAEWNRLAALRQARPDTVLGVWRLLFEDDPATIEAAVRRLAGRIDVPYLNLLGVPAPEGYERWLGELIPTASVEVWDGHGHYPHLVDRDRFLARVRQFEESL